MYNREIGYVFYARRSFVMQALGRALIGISTALATTVTVNQWEEAMKTKLASVSIDPQSSTRNGFAWDMLASQVFIQGAKKYRLTQTCSILPERDLYTSMWSLGNVDPGALPNDGEGTSFQYGSYNQGAYSDAAGDYPGKMVACNMWPLVNFGILA